MPRVVNLGAPTSPAVYTKKYEKFRGVDFSCDASMVGDAHSPDAKNLIADAAGFPEKRPGWRTVENFSWRIKAFPTSRSQTLLG